MKKSTHVGKLHSRTAASARKSRQARTDLPGFRAAGFTATLVLADVESETLLPETSLEGERDLVLFACQAPDARQVHLAGTFNDWSVDTLPLVRQEDGSWMTELLLPHGRYEYRFLVDGQWRDDPKAAELVANPYGSFNAVLIV